MTTRSPRQVAITAGQYLIALLAFAWVLKQIDIAVALDRLVSLDLITLFGILFVSVLGVLARFDTWAAVLAPLTSVGYWAVGRISLSVNFINQLLPSRLSGRLAAPFVIRGTTGMDYADATAVSGVHTGMYAIFYGTASTAGLLAILLFEPISLGLLALLAISTALYIVAGVVVLMAGTNLRVLDPLVALLARLAGRIPRFGTAFAARIRGLADFTDASTQTFSALASNRRVWLRYAVGWSIVLLVAPAIRVWLLLTAFDVTFEPMALLPLYLVTGYSVTLLPISPGGVGVTEATATAVFVTLGVPSSVIVPIVFVDRIFGIYLPAALGWLPTAQLDLTELT